MQTKIGHYRKFILDYGYVAVLKVLERFEKAEKYEECHKIVKAIKEHSKIIGMKIPTRFENSMFDLAHEVYQSQDKYVTKDSVIRMINSSAREIINKINA